MATEATFTITAGDFPLGSVFEGWPDAIIELERVVPAVNHVVPYVWLTGIELGGIEHINDAFNHPPGVKKLALVDSIDHQHLLRVEWESDHESILQLLAGAELTVLRAVGTAEQWKFVVRGESRSDIAAFQESCRNNDFPVTLAALHALTPMDATADRKLTDAQREALRLAYKRGYYKVPREVALSDLAAELDISRQALAARLRRGLDRLLGNMFET